MKVKKNTDVINWELVKKDMMSTDNVVEQSQTNNKSTKSRLSN